MAVRAWAAELLQPVINVDRDLAINLLLRLCDVQSDNDALLGTQSVQQTLVYLASTHYSQIEGLLVRMIGSAETSAQKVGAQVLTLIATWGNKPATSLTEILCLSSLNKEIRAATAEMIAQVFSAAHTVERTFCVDALVRLFEDTESSVREQAAKCFHAFIVTAQALVGAWLVFPRRRFVAR